MLRRHPRLVEVLWRDTLIDVLALQLILDGYNSLFTVFTLARNGVVHRIIGPRHLQRACAALHMAEELFKQQ